MRWRGSMCLVSLLGLVGCQSSPLALLAPLTPPGPRALPVAPIAQPTLPSQRTGSLNITVRWPKRNLTNFNAQALPWITNALLIEVRDASGSIVGSTTLTRAAGNLPTTSRVILNEGSGYTVSVKAFAEAAPTPTSVVLAQGSALNVAIVWNQSTPLSLTLAPLFAPTITAVSSDHAGVGATLQLTGTNLDRGPALVIFPSGTTAPATLTGGTLAVSIPPGAGSGPMTIQVDGITSATTLNFREVSALQPRAAVGADALDRNEADGGIHTWLGDRFNLLAQGTDSSGGAIATANVDPWANLNLTAGTVTGGGAYAAASLGADVVTARSGQVAGTSSVVVAPPAGARIPIGTASAAQDVALTKVGNRYLAAWFTPGDTTLRWQFINADGSLDPVVHSRTAAGFADERVVGLACAGPEVVLAYRIGSTVNGVTQNGVYFQIIDPVTGNFKKDAKGNERLNMAYFDTSQDSDAQPDISSNGQGYLLSFVRWNTTRNIRKVLGFTLSATGDISAINAVYYSVSPNYQISRYQDDAAGVVASGSQFVMAQHFTYNGQTMVQFDTFDSTGHEIASPSAYIHDKARLAAMATNGSGYLLAEIQVGLDNSTLYTYRLSPSLLQIGQGTPVTTLNTPAIDTLNNRLNVVWDGTEYLVSFVRRQTLVLNGQPVTVNQPMIQAIGTDGSLLGPAYPMAPAGTSPALVPTSEGGLAVWISDGKTVVARRMKFH